jgi:hypothetical protein
MSIQFFRLLKTSTKIFVNLSDPLVIFFLLLLNLRFFLLQNLFIQIAVNILDAVLYTITDKISSFFDSDYLILQN